MKSLEWQDRAACKGMDPKRWLGDKEAYVRWADFTDAVKVCNGCPVQAECLEWQLDFEADLAPYERWGIFGGMTPEQRAVIARKRETAADRARAARTREAVALHEEGVPMSRIAERLGVSKSSVSLWIRKARTA